MKNKKNLLGKQLFLVGLAIFLLGCVFIFNTTGLYDEYQGVIPGMGYLISIGYFVGLIVCLPAVLIFSLIPSIPDANFTWVASVVGVLDSFVLVFYLRWLYRK